MILWLANMAARKTSSTGKPDVLLGWTLGEPLLACVVLS
jgi:hypothetical protein